MKANIVGKAVAIIISLSLFSACGELETLLPSNGSYQVRTLVNNGSLESCSIIRSNDKIRPYFAVSVVNDPDLIGLLVYFENLQGEIAGEKVRYILESYAEESAPAETEIVKEAKPDKTTEKASEETNTPEEAAAQKTEENEVKEQNKEQNAEELPEQGTVKETQPVTNTKPIVKNTDREIVVKSLSEELPYLPLSPTLEIGPYTMVFEAIGVKETLSRTETNIFYLGDAEFSLKDILIYLSGESGSQLISPGTTVMLETRLNFDSRLDPYVVWYNGKNIISEGKISGGAGTILWKAPEQAGFYSLRMEIFPFQLRRNNYTGVSREITLPVSPKAVNLGYFFENNQEHTPHNSLAAGTAYPERLRLITAMTAAVKEAAEASENTKKTGRGKEKQSVPSALPPVLPPALPPPPELLQWYQFDGSLRNAMSPLADTQSLSPATRKAPRWAAAGQSYGLSTGVDDVYSLSPIKFFRKENDQGGGIFLFHIMPAAEGIIFSAFFPLQSSATDGVWMDMVRKENGITLRLSAQGAVVEIPVYLTFFEPQTLIPIVVEFYIRPYRLEAKLSLSEKYSLESKVGSIKLPGALSGECSIKLGGGIDKSITDKSMIDKSMTEKSTVYNSGTDNAAVNASLTVPSSDQSTTNTAEPPLEETLAPVTAAADSVKKDAGVTTASATPVPPTVNQYTIWDELAILFSAVPLVEEEPSAEFTVEEQYAAGAKPAELKSDNHVSAVQVKAAVNTGPAVTGNAASLNSTPKKEKISLSDTDKTETKPTEGDKNLLLPAADDDNSIQEIAPSSDEKQAYSF